MAFTLALAKDMGQSISGLDCNSDGTPAKIANQIVPVNNFVEAAHAANDLKH